MAKSPRALQLRIQLCELRQGQAWPGQQASRPKAQAFSMGENEQGERLCKDMFAAATGKCRYNDTTTFYLPGVRCYAGLEYALEARVRLCPSPKHLAF